MRILWAFELLCAKSPETGEPIPIDLDDLHEVSIPRRALLNLLTEVCQGTVIAPNPFKCSFQPRGQMYLDAIQANFAKAQETFKLYEYESDPTDS